LPPEIGELKNLQELDLMIEELPPEIGQLQKLQKLCLVGITELPPEIGQLQNLKELWLKSYSIIELPPEIGQLQNLKELWLESYSITELPPEIGQLQNLKELRIQANLTELPPEIGQLQNLQNIYLIYCPRITTFPSQLGQLANLELLSLSSLRNFEDFSFPGNNLTELPREIGQLQKLQTLNLRDSQITELPPEIAQLQNLKTLDLRDNQITELPPEIAELQNLREVSLTDNPIQDLSALANHPNQKLKVWAFRVELSRQYWTHLSQWKAEWLLTENNAELRRVLIQQIGYDRICEELQAIELDSWREYTLLKIDVRVDDEPIHLLKMTCPSTNRIHVLRVPPDLTSAREAISWANWDIDPEAFAAET
jgi:Leucine-rich repeat (LRR) protein